MTRAFEEIIDFIVGGTSPGALAAFTPSEGARESVAELLGRQKDDSLSPEKKAELAHDLDLEHIMRLPKARARLYLS